jgi:hypothetical protein
MRLRVLLCSILLSIPLAAQTPDPWAPIRFLAGQWKGTAEGEPGVGTVVRSYEFVLKDRYLHERNRSTYEKEVHDHWSFFSYDRGRKRLVLRQFHQEGFVNQYVFDPDASTSTKLVFVSESLENLGKWRARETYEIKSPDEFIEIFEIAAPSSDFKMYSKNTFKRATDTPNGR